MKFVTKELILEKPAILELVQHDGGIVDLVVRASVDSPAYCLGIFKRGELHLCAVSQKVMASMGIKHDVGNHVGVKLSVKYT